MEYDLPIGPVGQRRLRALLFGLRCGLCAAVGAFLFGVALLYAILDYATAGRGLFAENPAPEGTTGSPAVFILPAVVGVVAALLPGRVLGLPVVVSMLLSPVAAGVAFAGVWWPLLNDMMLPLMHADTDAFAWFFCVFVWFAVLVVVSVLWPADRSRLRAFRLLLLALELTLAATLISPHQVLIAWWCLAMVVVPAAAHIDRQESQQ